MLKLIILAAIALLVGLGGGSAFSVLKAKKAFASQGALHAKAVSDSLAKLEAEGSQHAAAAAPDDSSGKGADSSHASPVHTSTGEAPGASVPPGATASSPKGTKTPPAKSAPPATTPATDTVWNRAVATVESGATSRPAAGLAPRGPALPSTAPDKAGTTSLTPERIGKIFAAMPAKEAAKVLVQLDDADVQAILGAVSAKHAAAILQNLPPVRAAAISRAELRGGVTKP